MIRLNCNQSSAMKSEWIIRNCTTNSCTNRIQLNATIVRTSSELYLPSRTLQYGTYQFELTVTMTNSSWLNTSKSTYVQIVSSSIFVNPFYLGTSMVTIGYAQDLLLDPGSNSVDLDNHAFNTSVSSEENISVSTVL